MNKNKYRQILGLLHVYSLSVYSCVFIHLPVYLCSLLPVSWCFVFIHLCFCFCVLSLASQVFFASPSPCCSFIFLVFGVICLLDFPVSTLACVLATSAPVLFLFTDTTFGLFLTTILPDPSINHFHFLPCASGSFPTHLHHKS